MTGDPPTGDVTLRDIYAARARIRDFARRTPLQRSVWLSERTGLDVYLKLECWQRTNSFKARGAYNAMASLDAATRQRGIVTASAGNHGQAVALAAAAFDARADIFVPDNAPETKKDRIRSFGAELHVGGAIYDEAAAAARAFAERRDAHYLHAFSEPAVVAGQGTVGLEIAETLPSARTVLVPVGGGGLIAGIGTALRALGSGARVLGVQSDRTRSMYEAFEAGGVVETPIGETLADGLAGETEEVSYRRARAVADAMHLVREERLPAAIRSLFQKDGVVAEGAGSVGVALLLEESPPVEDGPVVVVISGGNIDAAALARIFDAD